MTFRFIHTADLQIGKPFRRYPERVAGRLEGARLAVIDRLAEQARSRGARHVLVAGDVYDSESLPPSVVRQPLARMARHADLAWLLLPGNHDPARPGGIWARVAAQGLPANVLVSSEPRPLAIAPGVVVLPAPLLTRRPGRDPTVWMDGAETPEGTVRIGLAHGSVQGFGSGSEGDAEAIIDAARARRARLDFLALGDWHGATRINARTWYSGTPEPERFKDNEPGEALAVQIAGAGAEPAVERVATGHYVWIEERTAIASAADLALVERRVRARAPSPDRVVLRLVLEGNVAVGEIAAIEQWQERFSGDVEHLEVDMDGMSTEATIFDADVLGPVGELRTAADDLLAASASEDAALAAEAREALAILVTLAREAREARQ